MEVETIFQALYVAGATVRVRGESLEVSAPNGLPTALREAIAVHKPAMIAHLRRSSVPIVALDDAARLAAAAAFLAELERAGVSVTVTEIAADDVRLSVRTPRPLPDAMTEAIRRHKPAIAEILLRRRAERGSNLLWEMERAGKAETPEYEQLFRHWTNIRCGYEVLSSRNQTATVREAPAA